MQVYEVVGSTHFKQWACPADLRSTRRWLESGSLPPVWLLVFLLVCQVQDCRCGLQLRLRLRAELSACVLPSQARLLRQASLLLLLRRQRLLRPSP